MPLRSSPRNARPGAKLPPGEVAPNEGSSAADGDASPEGGLRALGEVAVGVAHDLQNVIGAVQLRLQVLEQDPACMAAQSKNIRAIRRVVEEADRLLTHLQQLAAPGADDASDPQGPLDLGPVILEAAEMAGSGLRLRSRQAGIQLGIVTDVGPLPPVTADAAEVRRVLLNLLIHARDAMPTGGTIRISAAAEGSEVVVRVEGGGHVSSSVSRRPERAGPQIEGPRTSPAKSRLTWRPIQNNYAPRRH